MLRTPAVSIVKFLGITSASKEMPLKLACSMARDYTEGGNEEIHTITAKTIAFPVPVREKGLKVVDFFRTRLENHLTGYNSSFYLRDDPIQSLFGQGSVLTGVRSRCTSALAFFLRYNLP
jgi:hypothetical protein